MESASGEMKQKNVTDLAGVGEILAPLSVPQALTSVFLCSIYTSFIASGMIKSDERNNKSDMPWKQERKNVS